MMYRTLASRLLVCSSLLGGTGGCIVIGGSGWCFFGCGPQVWTDKVTEKITLNTASLRALDVKTHNGSIAFEGQGDAGGEAYVVVTKRGAGLTSADADRALEAIEVYVISESDGTQRLGWKWKGLKHLTWSAKVSFDIKAPGDVQLHAKTHNGPLDVHGAAGEVRLTTHNGGINVSATGAELYAETHNGEIVAKYSGPEVDLTTHNGSIVTDFGKCHALAGSVTTHNGSVEIALGANASTALAARTHNGSIACDVPLESSEFSRHKLTGTIGSGEGHLAVTTHNGRIRLRKAAG